MSLDISLKRHTEIKETIWISGEYLCDMAKISVEYLGQVARYKYKSLVPPIQRNNEVLSDVGASWRC